MLDAIWRPIKSWPGGAFRPAAERQRSPFSADYFNTLNLLEHELGKLYATNIVIHCECVLDQVRNDHQLKQGAALTGPAVLLSFTNGIDGHQYTYPCDMFLEPRPPAPRYADNLRAIALALKALRQVERYGVTRKGEQYLGFRALPAAPESRPKLTAEAAAQELARLVPGVDASQLLVDQSLYEMAYKLARKRFHPDAGGAREDYDAVTDAGAALAEHFAAKQQRSASSV